MGRSLKAKKTIVNGKKGSKVERGKKRKMGRQEKVKKVSKGGIRARKNFSCPYFPFTFLLSLFPLYFPSSPF